MESDTAMALGLFGEVKALILNLGVAGARFLGVMVILPIFHRAEIGMVVRAGVALGLAIPASRGIAPELQPYLSADAAPIAILVAKEILIGGLIGALFGLPFWAIQAAGELIDSQRSIGESGVNDPTVHGQTAGMAALLTFTAMTLFVVEGGLSALASTVYLSYGLWPITDLTPSMKGLSAELVAESLWRFVTLAISVAVPMVLLFLISDFAVMAMGRLGGRVEISSMLPLIKNLLFCVAILIYASPLFDGIGAALLGMDPVEDTLRRLAGDE